MPRYIVTLTDKEKKELKALVQKGGKDVQTLLQEAGMKLLCLPAYSPDLNLGLV